MSARISEGRSNIGRWLIRSFIGEPFGGFHVPLRFEDSPLLYHLHFVFLTGRYLHTMPLSALLWDDYLFSLARSMSFTLPAVQSLSEFF